MSDGNGGSRKHLTKKERKAARAAEEARAQAAVDALNEQDAEYYYEVYKKNPLVSFLQVLFVFIVAIGLFALLKTFVIGTYEIPSSSMEDTIMTGDLVIADRVSYHFRGPEAGEIVTFKDPQKEDRTLIKRVIAKGGQTVDLDSYGRVVVDGKVKDEDYVRDGAQSMPLDPPTGQQKIQYPYKVPDGKLWVMGDNRENSADSRYFGAIPESSVTGHAMFIYWPTEHWRGL